MCGFDVVFQRSFAIKKEGFNQMLEITRNTTIANRKETLRKDSSCRPHCTDSQEVIQEDILVPLVSDAPKLKGLPGEFVWTVKDKDGLISKLYEYDFTSDYLDGDTEIRRIRQYSVYFDKDCLLDSIGSKTVIHNETNESRPAPPRRFNRHGMEKLKEIDLKTVNWKSIKQDGLDIEYAVPISKVIASQIFEELESTLEYFTGDLSKIKVFGKIYPLPRQQVAYGDSGITYTYSGVTVPALPWPAPVLALRDFLVALKGIKYDFVLVNKYRNGNDHMGEHRDNEPELDPTYPIASISFGQERTFVLKHRDARKPGKDKKPIPPGKNLFQIFILIYSDRVIDIP
ncbi:hypothetical protein PYW07_004177 [Mythimna separata]|uniref:DNA oxidative demethylase ALKBH2 n=1 Tax=Mythimna separata TaxID=271217 RepID=A0AAD8DTT1_MYTSE|nr:hypothetical protein PYW07_004177 [Mythimna separata]